MRKRQEEDRSGFFGFRKVFSIYGWGNNTNMSGDTLPSASDGLDPKFFIDLSKVRELPDEELVPFLALLYFLNHESRKKLEESIGIYNTTSTLPEYLQLPVEQALKHYILIRESRQDIIPFGEYIRTIMTIRDRVDLTLEYTMHLRAFHERFKVK